MEVDSTVYDGHLPRVNGSMLSNYVGKSVLILAELMSVSNIVQWSERWTGQRAFRRF